MGCYYTLEERRKMGTMRVQLSQKATGFHGRFALNCARREVRGVRCKVQGASGARDEPEPKKKGRGM